jgi:hypothetical protein
MQPHLTQENIRTMAAVILDVLNYINAQEA